MTRKTVEEWRKILVAEGAVIFPDGVVRNKEWDKINESFAGEFQALQGSPAEAVAKRTRDRMAREMRADGWTVWVESRSVTGGSDTADYAFSTMRKREQVVGRQSWVSPDIEFQNDWKKFVEGFLPRKFDQFSQDDARDGPGRYLDLAIESIKRGDPFYLIDAINEDSRDYGYEEQYRSYQEAVKEFAKEWGEDPADVKKGMDSDDIFREIFDEIYEDREQFNWDIFFGNEEILVWNSNDAVHTGWIGDPQESTEEVKDNPELKKWAQYAIRFISDKQIGTIIDNGFDYDVTMFIGGIVNVADVIKAMMSQEGRPVADHTGDVIVGAYDGLNGAGYFEHGTTRAHVGLVFGDKSNPVHIDWGSYSLGDVFGTNEWTWH